MESIEGLMIESAIHGLDLEPSLLEESLNFGGGCVSQRHALDLTMGATVATDHLERDLEVEYLLCLVAHDGSGESRDSPTVRKSDLAVVWSPIRWAELVKAARAATWQVQDQPRTNREVPDDGAETCHLIVVREEMHEPAERDDHESEGPIEAKLPHVGADKLDMPPNHLGLTGQLGAAAVEHWRRGVDPHDVDAGAGNRQQDLTGSTSQFQHRPTGPECEFNVKADIGAIPHDSEVVVRRDRQGAWLLVG